MLTVKERTGQWSHFGVEREEGLMEETIGVEDRGTFREDGGHWPCHVICEVERNVLNLPGSGYIWWRNVEGLR